MPGFIQGGIGAARIDDSAIGSHTTYSSQKIEQAIEEYGYAIVAPEYSASSTYTADQYVIYEGILYRCIEAITVAEPWTAAHWEATFIGKELDNQARCAAVACDDELETPFTYRDFFHVYFATTTDLYEVLVYRFGTDQLNVTSTKNGTSYHSVETNSVTVDSTFTITRTNASIDDPYHCKLTITSTVAGAIKIIY